MKFFGSDICAFYREWPPGECWYHDEAELEFEDAKGASLLDPSAKYDGTELGLICWQGPVNGCQDPGPVKIGSVTLRGERGAMYDFDQVLRAWLKARSVITVSVEIPRDQLESFELVAATNKWKVWK